MGVEGGQEEGVIAAAATTAAVLVVVVLESRGSAYPDLQLDQLLNGIKDITWVTCTQAPIDDHHLPLTIIRD